MELDRIAATLRPRRPWEGLDLGFALARTWLPTLWPLWWIAALPAALLALAVLGGRPDWWVTILWWLKPVYEAPLAVWIGRALFGERVPLAGIRPVLRVAWSRRLLPFLLWRRLSPSRSFSMPIALLEGLGGRAGRLRRQALSAGDATAGWLTLICWHFESILWLGLLLSAFFAAPQGLPRLDLGSALLESGSWPYWASCVVFLLAASILAPFYVAGGFALYLTRRTELEAWDLELAFRQAQAPTAGGGRGADPGGAPAGRAGALALAALLALPLLAAWPAGEPSAQGLPDPDRARGLIAEILADETFGRTRELELWVPIGGSEDTESQTPEWLEAIAEAIALIGPALKWLLLALAVSAVALLAWRVARERLPRAAIRLGRRPGRPEGATLLAAPQALPADLGAAVRARLAAGDPRGALALLYRGGIARLAALGVEIPAGATEGDCLRLAAAHRAGAGLGPFRELTRAWQALAYAHLVPSPQAMAHRLDPWLAWIEAGPGPGPEPEQAEPAPPGGAERAGTGHAG